MQGSSPANHPNTHKKASDETMSGGIEAQTTLVLTQGYEPSGIVPWYQAITLWFQNKVEILESYDQDIHSAHITMKVPAVVRVLGKIKRHRKPLKFSRVNVYSRDDWQCQFCGTCGAMEDLTYDHVVPRSQGGKTTWSNIVTSCPSCNSKKANKTPTQAGMSLRKKPVQPVGLPGVTLGVRQIPEIWRPYVSGRNDA